MDITPVDPNPVQLPTQEISVPVPIQENPSTGLDQILPDFQGKQPVKIETTPEAPNQVLGPQDFNPSLKQPLDPYKHYPYTTLHTLPGLSEISEKNWST